MTPAPISTEDTPAEVKLHFSYNSVNISTATTQSPSLQLQLSQHFQLQTGSNLAPFLFW